MQREILSLVSDDGPAQAVKPVVTQKAVTAPVSRPAMRPVVVGGLKPAQVPPQTFSRPVVPKATRPAATSNAAVVPKAKAGGAAKAGTGIKVSEDLKMKLQMEFAEMCPGDSKKYRLLPHEVKLAKDLAQAFEMSIAPAGGGEFTVSRPMEEGF